jgi:hypothetical protein
VVGGIYEPWPPSGIYSSDMEGELTRWRKVLDFLKVLARGLCVGSFFVKSSFLEARGYQLTIVPKRGKEKATFFCEGNDNLH